MNECILFFQSVISTFVFLQSTDIHRTSENTKISVDEWSVTGPQYKQKVLTRVINRSQVYNKTCCEVDSWVRIDDPPIPFNIFFHSLKPVELPQTICFILKYNKCMIFRECHMNNFDRSIFESPHFAYYTLLNLLILIFLGLIFGIFRSNLIK